jgi:tetratricopeptide (TPR) repeat protein
VFALSNILLPIFYTLPRIRLEKKKNSLIKKIPPIMLIWAPVTWTIAFSFGLYYSINYYPNHKTEIYIGVGISLLSLLRRIGKRNNDMEDDFRRTFNEYLKDKERPVGEEDKLPDQDYKERLTKITTESLSKTGITAKEFAMRLNTELGMDMQEALDYATRISKDLYESKIGILKNNFSDILSLTFSEKQREIINREIDNVGKNKISLDEFAETLVTVQQLESEDWLTKAQKHLRNQEKEEALQCLDTSIKFNQGNLDALDDRGTLLQELGFHKDAIKDFTKIIDVNPNDFSIIYLRGCSLLSLCQFERSSDDINKAIQLSRDNATEKQIQIAKEKGFDSLESMYQQSLYWIDKMKDSPEGILKELRRRNEKEREKEK